MQAGRPGASLGLGGPQQAAWPGWGFSIWAAPAQASGGSGGMCAWGEGLEPVTPALTPAGRRTWASAAAAAGDLSGPALCCPHYTGAAPPCQGEWLRRPPKHPRSLHPFSYTPPWPSLSSPLGSSPVMFPPLSLQVDGDRRTHATLGPRAQSWGTPMLTSSCPMA